MKDMFTAIAAIVLSTWTATPASDVWVYPHSSDPGGEEYMRVWGDGEKAIDSIVPPADSFSYGYMQFDLKDLPKGELKAAKLTVWNVANEELKDDVLTAAPLEVFGLKGTFVEKTFSFLDAKCQPVAPSLGKAKSEKGADGIKLEFDLLDAKGEFAKLVEASRSAGSLGLALASKISPEDSRGMIYKVNTKEGPEKLRPSLSLTFAD